jgi:serine/threonine-protein kinase
LQNRPAWLPFVIAAAVVLVLILAIAKACSGPSTSPAATTNSAPPSSTATDKITVNQADYVGRALDPVRSELQQLGLVVSVREIAADGDAGTVTAVSPDGTLARGDTVTVSVVRAADPVKKEPDKKKKKGH